LLIIGVLSLLGSLLVYLFRNLFHNEVAARKFNHISLLFSGGA